MYNLYRHLHTVQVVRHIVGIKFYHHFRWHSELSFSLVSAFTIGIACENGNYFLHPVARLVFGLEARMNTHHHSGTYFDAQLSQFVARDRVNLLTQKLIAHACRQIQNGCLSLLISNGVNTRQHKEL